MLMIILYALAAIGVGTVFYGVYKLVSDWMRRVDKLVADWMRRHVDPYEDSQLYADSIVESHRARSTQPDLYQARVDFFKDESAAGHQGDVGVSGPSGVRFEDFVCDQHEVERRMRVSIAEQARL